VDAEKTEKDSGVLSFLNGPSGFLPVRITTSKKNEDNGSGISIGLVLVQPIRTGKGSTVQKALSMFLSYIE